MRLVILDGHTLSPGDLSWQEIESLADVTYFDRTPAAQVAERLRDADAALTNKVHIGADV